MKQYDTTFIIDGALEVDEREKLITKFSTSLKKRRAKIDQIVRWGQRVLAYAIKKRLKGYYVIFYYTAETSLIKDFERELGLDEKILRYMTVIFDGKHPSYIGDEGVQKAELSNSESTGETLEVLENTEETVENNKEPDKMMDGEKETEDRKVESDNLEIKMDNILDESTGEDEEKPTADVEITEIEGETGKDVNKEDE